MNYAVGYFVFYYPMHDAHSRPVRNVLHVSLAIFVNSPDINKCDRNVSGYVCNRGSPSGERDTASPRGRYGERPQRDSCLKIHM